MKMGPLLMKHFIFSSSVTLPLMDGGECVGKKNQTQRRTDKKQKKNYRHKGRRKKKKEERKK
jgi:hypothetical protein